MRQVTELREIQSMALEMFVQLSQFCKERNIKYYLAYGTLLGAVRHHGFIPWDDDIDIWMKRYDYDRFVAEFPEWGNKHGLYLNSPSTVNRNYNRVYSQICMKHTQLIDNKRINNFQEGFFLDVFPVDGTPNNPALRWLRMTHLQLIKILGTASAFKDRKNKNSKQKVMFIAAPILRHFNTSIIMHKYDQVARKSNCESSEYVQILEARTNGRNRLMPKRLFDQVQESPFESAYAFIPVEYDEILTIIYGDYMKLPPEEKRKPHHDFDLYIDEAYESTKSGSVTD